MCIGSTSLEMQCGLGMECAANADCKAYFTCFDGCALAADAGGKD
jgi:hypothetical protein